jgi:hypothetical protein
MIPDQKSVLESQWISGNHMAQCIDKQIGILAAIKPEDHFFKVCREEQYLRS